MNQLRSWNIQIVGESFDNLDGTSRQAEIAQCDIGESVTLIHDPLNEHDVKAVKVISMRGIQIGFLPKKSVGIRERVIAGNAVLATIIEIRGKDTYGVWIKVSDNGHSVKKDREPLGTKTKGCAICGLVLFPAIALLGTKLLT